MSELFITLMKGLVVGLAIAIPLGPVGLLALEKSTTQGKRAGLSVALGMNLADTLIGIIGLLGVSVIMDFAQAHVLGFRLMLCLVFIVMGAIMLKTRYQPVRKPKTTELASNVVTGFFLTFSPVTLLVLMSMLPLVHIEFEGVFTFLSAVSGIALGSLFWGLVVVFLGSKLQDFMGGRTHIVKTIAGTVFIVIGVAAPLFALQISS